MFLSQILIYSALSLIVFGILFEPFIGVITYYVLDIIRPQNLFWWALGGSRLSLWISGATIISWLFHLLKDRKTRGFWTAQNKLMVCFWITIVLSHAFSFFKDVSWISFIRISKMILIYFIAATLINNKKRIRLLVWGLVLSIGYLAIRGNWQYFVLGYHQITEFSYGQGVSLDNNGYAMLFVMVLPFVYFLIFTEKRIWTKLFLIGLAPILIHAIILTYSRSGFLGMCTVCALSLLRTKKKAVIGIAGILFIAVIARLAGPPVIDRLRTVSNYEEDPAAMGRIEAWKAGLRMMADRPFIGVGLDNYRYFAKEYNPEGVQTEIVAHNAFIHTGGEAGIPAMILYILILFFCFRDMGIIRKRFYLDKDGWICYYSSMLEVSLWGYTVCGLFLTLAWFEMFYPLLALIVSLKLIAGEEKPVRKPGATFYSRPEAAPTATRARGRS